MNYRVLSCVLLVLFAPAAAAGGRICWIDRVVAEGAGIRVFFGADIDYVFGAVVTNTPKALPRRFKIAKGLIRWENGDTELGLLLKPGESAPMSVGPENNCKISFGDELGHRGLTAEASFALPGEEPQSVKEFIPAQ